MSQRAMPATRNEATKRWKHPKMTPPAELTIGTAIRGSHERLRTVANGCGRERNVERTHPQPPDPQSETGTLATHSGVIKKIKLTCFQQYPRHLPNAWSRKQPLQQRQTRARRDWWQDTTFLSPSFILQHWCHSSHATQGHV